MQKIPTFIQIPRCAGTAMLGKIMSAFFYYGTVTKQRQEAVRIYIGEEGGTLADIMLFAYGKAATANAEIFKNFQNTRNLFFVDYKNLDVIMAALRNKQLSLFALCITPEGISSLKTRKYAALFEAVEAEPVYFTLFREPFSRAISMFNYLNSEKSYHEPTHGRLKQHSSFNSYIVSPEAEEGWLVRRLTAIPDAAQVTEENYEEACKLLSKCKIADVAMLESLAEEVFLECYNISLDACKAYIGVPAANYSKALQQLSLEDLNDSEKKIFLERNKFDYRIYNQFLKPIS